MTNEHHPDHPPPPPIPPRRSIQPARPREHDAHAPDEAPAGESIYPALPPKKPAPPPQPSIRPAAPDPHAVSGSIYPAIAPKSPPPADDAAAGESIYPALPPKKPAAHADDANEPSDSPIAPNSIVPLPPRPQPVGSIAPLRPAPTQQATPAPPTLDRRRARGDVESVSAIPIVSLQSQQTPTGTADARSKYSIIKELGRGGMGAVFAVTDKSLGRTVAMKVSHTDDEASRSRFLREARITGQLEHPNIVPVHELANDGTQDYFTMKMVRGRALSAALAELRDRIRRGASEATFPLAQRLDVFRKVCDGLAYAHSCGVLHRDLKPDNIMVGEFGEVQVMDWGLARLLDEPGADDAPAAPGIAGARSTRGK
ncbi:MAG: protein kinase, partial [Planctomycetota bacterium]